VEDGFSRLVPACVVVVVVVTMVGEWEGEVLTSSGMGINRRRSLRSSASMDAVDVVGEDVGELDGDRLVGWLSASRSVLLSLMKGFLVAFLIPTWYSCPFRCAIHRDWLLKKV
jgi:hypothetical protein